MVFILYRKHKYQNTSSIIKDNDLKYYDEYKILLLEKCRYSQDNFMVEEPNEED